MTSFSLWSLHEAAGQPDAGSRIPKGPLIVASSTRASFCRTPPAPRAVPPCRLAPPALAVQEGRRGTDGRGDRRAAVPGPGVRHRHRQGADGRDDPGAVGDEPGAAGVRDPRVRHHQAGGAGAGGLAALLAGARGGDGEHRRLLEAGVLPAGGRGVRVRAGRRQAGQEPARPAQAGPVRFPVAGRLLRARRDPVLLRAGPGVPGHPAAHPLPAGPDRRAHPGEEPHREAAGISGDQAVRPWSPTCTGSPAGTSWTT